MDHQDGPMYEDFVNIISLGGIIVFYFTDTVTNNIISLILEQGSLLIFTSNAYNKW